MSVHDHILPKRCRVGKPTDHPPKEGGTFLEKSLEEIYRKFDYDPVTGELTNKIYKNVVGKKPKIGSKIINKRRMIWTMMEGYEPDPSMFVIPLDGNNDNNTWVNLVCSDRSIFHNPGHAEVKTGDENFHMQRVIDKIVMGLPEECQQDAYAIEEMLLVVMQNALSEMVPRTGLDTTSIDVYREVYDKESYEARYILRSGLRSPFS